MKNEKPPTSKACATCGTSIFGFFSNGETIAHSCYRRKKDKKQVCEDCYFEEKYPKEVLSGANPINEVVEELDCASCDKTIWDYTDGNTGERLCGNRNLRKKDNKRICDDCYAEEFFGSIPDKPIKEKVCDLLNELINQEDVFVWSPPAEGSKLDPAPENSIYGFSVNGPSIQITIKDRYTIVKK